MPHRSSVVSVLAGLLLFLLMGSAAGAATLTVTSTADSGAGSLRDAIAIAAAGDTITFAADITTINLTSDQLSIDKNLTIDGGSGVTVTRQAGSPNFRIFTIASGNTVILNSLTISNGNSDLGGGIANYGTLTVTNSTFSDNSADVGDGGGGGISNYGTLTVTNSTFSSNSSGANGGGIYSYNSTVHLSNTILANSPSGGDCASSGGTITASGVNLVEDGTCSILGALTGDPQLGPLQV